MLIKCPHCINGVAGRVSRDMALDAGEPKLRGQPIRCDFCNGSGVLIVEDEDGGKED